MKNVIKFILFSIIFVLLLFVFSGVLSPYKTSSLLKDINTERKNSIDALFVGDSDVYTDISPMEIYEKYGLSSYDYASPAISNITLYYLMQEALKNQHPKVVVMDTAMVFDRKDDTHFTHVALDPINFDKIKEKAINDKIYHLSTLEKFEFILPIFKFHDRWKNVSPYDFYKIFTRHDYMKGYKPSYQVVKAKGYRFYMKKGTHKIKFKREDVLKYILKSQKYCQENDIKFLLVSLPSTREWNYTKHVKIVKWARNNNVAYVDFNAHLKEIGVNFRTDTRDGGTHLNSAGATKVSNYLGNYLKENYNLKDHRHEKSYKVWNQDLKYYNMDKEKDYAPSRKKNINH